MVQNNIAFPVASSVHFDFLLYLETSKTQLNKDNFVAFIFVDTASLPTPYTRTDTPNTTQII